MNKLTSLLALAFLVSGCSAKGPLYSTIPPVQPRDNEAVLYVYRPGKFEGSANYPTFRLDDGQCFELRNGGFFQFLTTSGHHTITLVKETIGNPLEEPVDLEIELPNQEAVFVRYEVDLNNAFIVPLAGGGIVSGTFSHRFVLVDNDEGSSEIVITKYQTQNAPCE